MTDEINNRATWWLGYLPAAGGDGSLLEQALELKLRLALLAEERMCAIATNLVDDRSYMDDLGLEVAETSCAYEATVLSALVELRGRLDGARQG